MAGLHVVFDCASIESRPNNNKVTTESYSGIVPTKCVSRNPIALRVRLMIDKTKTPFRLGR